MSYYLETHNRGEYPRKLSRLSHFIEQIVLPQNVEYASQRTGAWFPIYLNPIDNSYVPEAIKGLYDTFKNCYDTIKKKDKQKVPIFLDCGSGFGMVGAIANIVGFDVYNVEIIEEAHEKAQEYGKHLVSEGIIKSERMHYINGSYYLPSYHDLATKGLTELFKSQDAGAETLININHALDLQKQKTIPFASSVPYTEEDYLDYDLIYCYPSDPLFNFAFPKQMNDLMKPGSYLVMPRMMPVVVKALYEGGFSKFKPVSENYDIFLVLQKTP